MVLVGTVWIVAVDGTRRQIIKLPAANPHSGLLTLTGLFRGYVRQQNSIANGTDATVEFGPIGQSWKEQREQAATT